MMNPKYKPIECHRIAPTLLYCQFYSCSFNLIAQDAKQYSPSPQTQKGCFSPQHKDKQTISWHSLQLQWLAFNSFISTKDIINLQQMQIATKEEASLKLFGKVLVAVELLILLFYAIFIRIIPFNFTVQSDPLVFQRFGAFMDTNVMILIGFGLLMTFIKTYSLSALSYTFFINAIVFQLYLLLAPLWSNVFNGFPNDKNIYVSQFLITSGAYCVGSVLIAFGGIIGRVGPTQILVASMLQAVAYAFNEQFNLNIIKSYDAGGTTTIHIFGAFFGLGMSFILGKKIKPHTKPEASYNSYILSMAGTLFLWIYWPAFNFGVAANNNFEQTLIAFNTLLSLTGSCISTFALTSLLSRKFSMEDILNATLAGGVAVSASCGVSYYPSVALVIGLLAGTASTLGFHFVTPFLQNKVGLYDTCGIANLHGIPGLLGGVISSIVIASYNTGFDTLYTQNFRSGTSIFVNVSDFLRQGGLQIAGVVTCLFFGTIFGVVTGFLISLMYDEDPAKFYLDGPYFHTGDEPHVPQSAKSGQITNSDMREPLIESAH